MATFDLQLPTELMKEFEKLANETDTVFGEMTKAGAKTAYEKVVSNMKRAFKDADELISKVQITKTYKTPLSVF